MNTNEYKNPLNHDRPYMIQHSGKNFENTLNYLEKAGFGGVVMNCEWHSEDEKEKYLENSDDFVDLDKRIEMAKSRNFGIWLYDEKGYPSGSADGLTMNGHPEYEAKGLAQLRVEGDYSLSADFEKIVYACKEDGTPAEFSPERAAGAKYVYVVKTAFEGSHAEKCGWGPRHYPNIMNRSAVKAFIDCTYERYYSKLKNFQEFEAVFTDEPSLMSGYVNCTVEMPYALIAWDDTLPEFYYKKYGVSVFQTLPNVFSDSEKIIEDKIRYWEVVGDMVRDAYFGQIASWCESHGLAFSGHCLLEECLDEHVPLYGNLMSCLKTFTWPGVDILTGDPEEFNNPGFPYYMAAQYVGSAAKMTGKTENVMVEICPIQNGEKDYSFEQERGTMNKIFFSGINHINSYLSAGRLGDKFNTYAEHAARITSMLKNANWNGRIGVYYPIETVQGSYRPSHIGVNCGAYSGIGAQKCMKEINTLTLLLRKVQLDSTIVDADWIVNAEIDDGCLCSDKLRLNTIVFPNALYIKSDVMEKLISFEKNGGKLIFAEGAPEGRTVSLNPVAEVLQNCHPDLQISGAESGSIWINEWIVDNKIVWFIINTSEKSQKITLNFRDEISIWDNDTGEITRDKEFIIEGYSSVFAVEG